MVVLRTLGVRICRVKTLIGSPDIYNYVSQVVPPQREPETGACASHRSAPPARGPAAGQIARRPARHIGSCPPGVRLIPTADPTFVQTAATLGSLSGHVKAAPSPRLETSAKGRGAKTRRPQDWASSFKHKSMRPCDFSWLDRRASVERCGIAN